MSKTTIAILAGGKSSRMGRDKSFVPFRGRPMIEAVLAAVAGLGDEQIIITNNAERYEQFGLPLFGDVYPDHGSLGGIYTAVFHASHPHTLVVACDMPWLNRPLLQHLLSLRHEAEVVVPRWEKFPEPLHAVYGKGCLPAMAAKLAAKRLKIRGFFGGVGVRFVEREEIRPFDENGRSFVNLNTPDELSAAQSFRNP